MNRIIGFLLSCFISGLIHAEPAFIPYEVVDLVDESPRYSPEGISTRAGDDPVVTYDVYREGATWVQVQFKQLQLGNASFVKIVPADGGPSELITHEDVQMMEAAGIEPSSSYFNGNKVEIELFISSEEKTGDTIFLELGAAKFGQPTKIFSEEQLDREMQKRAESVSAAGIPESICGATDDRTPSKDARVGRIMPVGCTGWLITNRLVLSAGHCDTGNMNRLQFNVPESLSDGTPQHPGPQDQYIIKQSFPSKSGGPGDDWAVFAAERNANTKKLPHEQQGPGFKIIDSTNTENVSIIGFGLDSDPPGSSNKRNQHNQVQQHHSGPLLDSGNENLISHKADTRGGNSGSPIVIADENGHYGDSAIGIHTHGGCESSSNSGTSFSNPELRKAINMLLAGPGKSEEQHYSCDGCRPDPDGDPPALIFKDPEGEPPVKRSKDRSQSSLALTSQRDTSAIGAIGGETSDVAPDLPDPDESQTALTRERIRMNTSDANLTR